MSADRVGQIVRGRGIRKRPQYRALPGVYDRLSKAAIWDALCEQVALSSGNVDDILPDPARLTAALAVALAPVLSARRDVMPTTLVDALHALAARAEGREP